MTGEEALTLAESHLAERELPCALKTFDLAEGLGADPDRCAAGRWLIHMLFGDFESAWRESDAITSRTPNDPQRLWRGEAISGKRVMIRCLHGFGDAVQFLRFVPALRRQARQIILEVAPHFVELARRFEGVEEVITWGDAAPRKEPAWDVQIEINELLPMLRLSANQLPFHDRYLKLRHEDMTGIQVETSSPVSTRVGMVWASGQWDPNRSLKFQDLAPILAVEGCEFWNLQGGSDRADWPEGKTGKFHTAVECADNMVALAAIISQMDLVISSDTLAVHLAGALGTPCWVLLQNAADWRWMHARADSPWYPAMQLFRRKKGGSWQDLTQLVADDLRSLIATRVSRAELTSP